MEPLWYDIGLYRFSPVSTVRTPHPENRPGERSESTVRRAWAVDATPENRQCPALELRTRHCRLSPSSAMANMEISSDQNASANFFSRAAAWRHSFSLRS